MGQSSGRFGVSFPARALDLAGCIPKSNSSSFMENGRGAFLYRALLRVRSASCVALQYQLGPGLVTLLNKAS